VALREQLALVEAEVAGELEALRGHRFLSAAIDRVLHDVLDLELRGRIARRHGEHAPARAVDSHPDHGIGLARRRREAGAVALERAAHLDREGREVVARRNIDAAEVLGQGLHPLQAEPAAGEQREREAGE